MIFYSQEFFKMSFKAESMKKAYMDACKWYATNVLSKDELHNVQVEFEKKKIDEEQFPTVVIHLFAVLSEEQLRERHCNVCRELHSNFFMNQHYNCNRCETNAYQKRTNDMLKVKIDYYKSLLSKRVEEDG